MYSNIWKCINTVHFIIKSKRKNKGIMLVDGEKVFKTIQKSFLINNKKKKST